MDIVIGLGVFLATVLLIEGIFLTVRAFKNPERQRVQAKLQELSFEEYRKTSTDLERKRVLSRLPWLNNLLIRVPGILWVEDVWRQSASRYALGIYFSVSLLIFAAVILVTSWMPWLHASLRILSAFVLGSIPFILLYRQKQKRMAHFESQLPDAVDLISRALKAGHAFSTGMRMVANDLGDPIGSEFTRTMAEVSYGADLNQAMKNMLLRVDCPDLKFFVMSVILQRETGGNLAEILGNLSRLMRERFKLHRKIKTLTAEGKWSAVILVLLPFVLIVALYLVNPNYVRILGEDPVGRFLVAATIIMQIAGIFFIRKIIRIQV